MEFQVVLCQELDYRSPGPHKKLSQAPEESFLPAPGQDSSGKYKMLLLSSLLPLFPLILLLPFLLLAPILLPSADLSKKSS